MSSANLSNITFDLVSTTSPETFGELEEVIGGVAVGQTAPLVDVTHLQSTAREYISGLADGDEFSVECNSIQASPSVQQQIIALTELTRDFRVTSFNTRVSPNTSRIYRFSAVVLGWTIGPGVGEQEKITLNFKITGAITRTEA